MKYIGAHVSAAGGVSNAVSNAESIEATAFALFTKNQRQWVAPPLPAEEITAFKQQLHNSAIPIGAVLPHNSYLTNLAHAEEAKWTKSFNAFVDELTRCEQLGLHMLNFHPGSHLKALSEEEALERVAQAINQALAATDTVVAVIENTAGQGTNLGYRFEHLRYIIERVEQKERVGVCFDTCHAFAAGYDLSTREGYQATWDAFAEQVGIEYLRGFHLNDAMKPLGSRVDRHAPLGAGHLGAEPFQWIMEDERFEGLPFILETPQPELWPEEIRRLKQWAGVATVA